YAKQTITINASTKDIPVIDLVDGRRVNVTLRYATATSDGSVEMPYTAMFMTLGYSGTDYMIPNLSNESGTASFYIPDSVECKVAMSTQSGKLDNTYFKCTDLVNSVTSGVSNTSSTKTISAYTSSGADNMVKPVEVIADQPVKLESYSTSLTVEMSAGSSRDISPGQYEAIVDDGGKYAKQTITINPGTTDNHISLDTIDVQKVTVTKGTSDTITVTSEGTYFVDDDTYYLEGGKTFVFKSESGSGDDAKVKYAKVEAVAGAATSLSMTATDASMTITGDIPVEADGTLTVSYSDADITATIDKGSYSVDLPVTATSATFTAEVEQTVAGNLVKMSGSQTFTGLADGQVRNVSLSVSGSDPEEYTNDAFTATVGSYTFGNGKIQLTINIENKTDRSTTYTVIPGSALRLDTLPSIVAAPQGGAMMNVVGYYDASHVGTASDGFDLTLRDLSGANSVTLDLSDPVFTSTGSKALKVYESGDDKAAKDKVSIYGFMYAVTINNPNDDTKNVSFNVNPVSGFQVSILSEEQMLSVAPGDAVKVYGNKDNVYYICLMPTNGGDQAPATPAITYSIVQDGSTIYSKTTDTPTVTVNEDSAVASGTNIYNSLSGMPVGIWIMIGVIIVLLILVAWMASKRGVFSRKN
ncbi:MAG: hypothetical protein IJ856_01390, partial [Candidatus Methanomethylophilaceae archaeon]|nr:hypothetical protein [Candidatus Methanomethylophilaceae archaeon]